MRKMLYLHIGLDIGGMQELRLSILKYINRSKYDIRLCCLSEKGQIGKEIEDLGFRVDVIGASPRMINVLSLFSILSYLRRNRFDIVHTTQSSPNLYGRLAALLAGVPHIIAEEQSYSERYNPHLRYLFRSINKILSRYTHRIVTGCNAVREILAGEEKIPREKFSVIYNAIDTKKFAIPCSKKQARIELGLHPDAPIIGCVASLAPRKGQIYLLQAMRYVLGPHPEAKLLFVGDGPSRKELETFVEQNRLGDSIRFLGHRRDIPLLFKSMDILASPSLKEAFAINLLEAMYMGIPCVATNIGGTPELVIDGRTGILVPPANPEALAGAIKGLLENKELAGKYGEAGRKRVLENFTMDRYIKKLEDIYDGLLSKK